jgi:predicted ATPase
VAEADTRAVHRFGDLCSGHDDPTAAAKRLMPHLRSIELRSVSAEAARRFPFTVPLIRGLPRIEFNERVTFFVGENGSGKSTLLEGLAIATNLVTVGSDSAKKDQTLEAQRFLGRALKVTWNVRAFRGFFLRAEDFFGFTKALAVDRSELLARLEQIDVDFADASEEGRQLARLPIRKALAEMERRYGVDLDANSHGESFLKLFGSRFVPGGLYILDEPEAPLSPQSQLALIAMIGEMVRQDAQFIIATHSPILLAFPGATIYSCDTVPLSTVAYEELDHVNITRDFLNGPERFLRHL